MSDQQQELNEKVASANTTLDGIKESLQAIPGAITAETQQITDYINAHQSGQPLDFTGLNDSLSRLNGIAQGVAGVTGQIADVFDPPILAPTEASST